MTEAASNVKVYVRFKPPSLNERGKRVVSNNKEKVVIGDKGYMFDSVFDEKMDQASIYDTSIHSLIPLCFDGYNATIFAYGQTVYSINIHKCLMQ